MRLLLRPVFVAIACLLVTGCVTSVPGYSGPPMQVMVKDNTAAIMTNHGEAGWVVIPDRAEVNNNTAKVWMTIIRDQSRDSKGTFSTDTIHLDAEWFDGKPFVCCEVFAKTTNAGQEHRGEYVPAATGCE